jgi:hypothetical protein
MLPGERSLSFLRAAMTPMRSYQKGRGWLRGTTVKCREPGGAVNVPAIGIVVSICSFHGSQNSTLRFLICDSLLALGRPASLLHRYASLTHNQAAGNLPAAWRDDLIEAISTAARVHAWGLETKLACEMHICGLDAQADATWKRTRGPTTICKAHDPKCLEMVIEHSGLGSEHWQWNTAVNSHTSLTMLVRSR